MPATQWGGALDPCFQIQQEIGFVFYLNKECSSTAPRDPFIARFPDDYGNKKTTTVSRPVVILMYFLASNAIDYHNQA
jgi:hypothetical protein